jgi:hypothetical protein
MIMPKKPPEPLYQQPKQYEQSANVLESSYVGSAKTIYIKIVELSEQLTQDIMQSLKCDADAAKSLVENHLAGYRNSQFGQDTLYASEDVVRLLDLKPRTTSAPSPNIHESSSFMLSQIYKGGHTAIQRKMEQLSEKLQTDIKNTLNCDNETAKNLIEHHLIGLRKPSRSSETLYASDDAVRLIELRPKDTKTWAETIHSKSENSLER